MEEIDTSGFIRELQRVLQHLYDPSQLRKSPLQALFGLAESANPSAALQKTIIDAINDLKPAKETPRHAEAWRTYQILSYSYIEQTNQVAVANNLGLSVRQLRRHQRSAEEALAAILKQRFSLDDFSERLLENIDQNERERELKWLQESFPIETVSLPNLLESILKTISPVIKANGIQVELNIFAQLPQVSGQAGALRQGLLNIIMSMVNAAPGGKITIRLNLAEKEITAEFSTMQNLATEEEAQLTERMRMAQKMIEVFGGRLAGNAHPQPDGQFQTVIYLPLTEQVPVLVVDDNNDTLLLFQRYLTGTRYQFLSTRDPEQALELAQELLPGVVVMDILLPGIDGWELLGRMRAHPRTREIPVITCTISPEEQLALALGSAAFLRKPVSREALLQTLDRLVDQRVTKQT